ncbi:MAG TPA: glycosyltransferase family 1 protein [Gemmatimonadaceae bacterium]|nr:glycosyltransferase family 1 protein [Gemmatimonadaceae bacterium]
MLRRRDITLRFSAEANWASELLLLAYDRGAGGMMTPQILRAWEQPGLADDEAIALIARVVAEEAAGRDARRDRARLTLLSATARRTGLPGPFDVVHSLRTPLPARGQIGARVRALTIHDVIPLIHPEWMYATAEAEVREIAASILSDDFVITISGATARDVTARLGIPPERIFVVPLAAATELFYREESVAAIDAVKARYGIPGGPYLLSLCTLEPRKNLRHLLACFHRLIRQEQLPDVRFALVGATGWKSDALYALLQENPDLRSRVVLTGYVPDADLAALYSGARAFVYPSLYEGFGLPVLEAMQCGAPVITSDTSSLPEVVGDAGLCVSPTDADALSEALLRLVTDDVLGANLAQRGLARSRLFSWDGTAAATVRAYALMLGTA